DRPGKRAAPVFEGVFHETTIAINGEIVARHDNAWTPIEVDVTRFGPRFILTVTARVPDERNYAERGLGVMLHGKQDWYGLQGGIWKSVRLEAREPLPLAGLAVAPDPDLTTHAVTVGGRVEGGESGTVTLTLGRNGETVASGSFEVGTDFALRLPVPAVELWSPDAPNLYDLTVTLGADTQTRTVGFRRF